MEETTPMAGKPNPPVLNKRVLSMFNKGPNQTAQQEQTEQSSANPEKSPPKKKKILSEPSTLESALDATTAGTSRDVTKLFSKFAEVMSESAAADTAKIKQLDDILREARNLESHLKEKKEHLRQTLSLLSDKLKG